MDVSCRNIKESDIRRVDQIANQFLNEIGWVRRSEIYEGIENKTFKVIEVDEVVVGFINWRVRKRDGVCVIDHIGVHRDYQSKGLGQELMSHLPITTQLVRTMDGIPSNRFYERLGFKLDSQKQGRKFLINTYIKEVR